MAIGSSPSLPTSGIASLDDVGQERRAEAEGNQQAAPTPKVCKPNFFFPILFYSLVSNEDSVIARMVIHSRIDCSPILFYYSFLTNSHSRKSRLNQKGRHKHFFPFTRRLMAQLLICKYKSKIIWKFTTDSIIDDLYAKKNRKFDLNEHISFS